MPRAAVLITQHLILASGSYYGVVLIFFTEFYTLQPMATRFFTLQKENLFQLSISDLDKVAVWLPPQPMTAVITSTAVY